MTDRAEITNKIGFITTDGASNMSAMMQDVEAILHEHFLDFDATEAHFICFPHQLHTAVSSMLCNCTNGDALENTMAEFESPEEDPDNPHTQSLADVLNRDPVAIARGIVNTICSSQLQCTDFKEIVETGNHRHRWQHDDGSENQIKFLTLIHDSPLCWGLTYLMINRFLYLCLMSRFYSDQIFKFFMAPDVMSNIFKNRLTHCEWIILIHIRKVLELQPAYTLQSVMCTEKTPILACVVPAFDALLSVLKKMQVDPAKQHLRSMLDVGINKMTSQYNNRRFFYRWIEDNWPIQHVQYARERIMKELSKY
ncbi:hypothetical protein K439DRAFT_1616520 [Ramaria rubella]|nr:hypothetical protein K439DRAFT_1616520 [Ramaria rubella]